MSKGREVKKKKTLTIDVDWILTKRLQSVDVALKNSTIQIFYERIAIHVLKKCYIQGIYARQHFPLSRIEPEAHYLVGSPFRRLGHQK